MSETASASLAGHEPGLQPLSDADLKPAVQHLLIEAGLVEPSGGLPEITLSPLAGGANNRVLLVRTGDEPGAGTRAVLKVYSRHPDDPRDRAGAEQAFLSFAWDADLRSIPRPLAFDLRLGLGLIEHIDGARLAPGEVDDDAVEQLIALLEGLNRHRFLPSALVLPEASEACFSVPAHVERVDARVRRLMTIEPSTEVDLEALAFVEHRLVPAWYRIREATQGLVAADSTLVRELGPEQRCISPSDLGFHNALRRPDGSLVFHDFEYAGWDDPGRLVCDLLCQPAVPVPHRYLERLTTAAIGLVGASDRAENGSAAGDADHHRARITALMPVYRIKWVCILLNELLPAGGHRRRLAGDDDLERRKSEQLIKAQQALDAIEDQDRPSRSTGAETS